VLPEFGEVWLEGIVEDVAGENCEKRFGPGQGAGEEVAGRMGGLFAGLVLGGHKYPGTRKAPKQLDTGFLSGDSGEKSSGGDGLSWGRVVEPVGFCAF
jgi:hypothetical protein